MITINQEPTYPNVTKTNLLYVVASGNITEPQFQYVMDIDYGSTTTRIKQYPNPAGVATYDVSRVLNDYLEPRTDVFAITSSTDYGSGKGTFTIAFGEEYGTSVSSSVTLYDGNGSVGDPGVSGSSAVVWGGTIDVNNGLGYNWDDVYSENIFLTSYPNSQAISSDFNYKKVGTTDYGVLSYKGSNVGGTIQATLKTFGGSTITTVNLKGTTDSVGTIIPSGPQNLLDAGVTPTQLNNTDWYSIDVSTDSFYFKIDKDTCNYDRTNFLFVNKQGAWDFHGISLPTRKNTNIKRETIVKPFVNYSSALSQYDVRRRGTDVYDISLNDDYVIATQYLTQGEAEWLGEMLESSEVYIQDGSFFIPIVITNASYLHNTNKKSQKIFQYEIQYQYANQRRVR
jgi:hypothetical protein